MRLLFSYGTLRRDDVQEATFGRRLEGRPDALVGFAQKTIVIDDPEFVAASGKAEHAIVEPNGDPQSTVPGMVFEVTDAELRAVDEYEPDGYARVRTMLASGDEAWVYVRA